MGEEFNQLIKICVTHPDNYREPLDSFIMTSKSYPLTGPDSYRDLPAFVKTSAFKAKTHANPDTLR